MTARRALRHVAVFYDDAEAVAAQIADIIEHDRRTGAAVLVCLPDALAGSVSRSISVDDRVTFLPADDRYARPVTAMDALWHFATAALAGGATHVQSIGQIGFDGSPLDDDWHWYERAVNEVFADVPLTATCLFDTRSVSPDTIACAHATHTERIGRVDTTSRCDVQRLLPRPVEVPQRRADLTLEQVDRPDAARHALERFDDDLAPGILERARLIVSELVTNAIIHGGGRAHVSYWHDPNAIFVEVADEGAGIDDPVAALRPPSLPVRDVGLWASHIEATRLHVAARHPHGTVVTAHIAHA